ncbi:cupin-like domain-containing protein [Candidatus Neptunochlamydia vexilliferae]|uniref:JmjC domain-containing protein n=1 Tax=Candidatus Neptunichlamydia vexilliferae TaxID=1651774 RepID=A0ABS0AXY1_9BACT|nr:cupin-like domain-containing protein [Candidatus Neptunochlamydia vexilliferae]MBF5058991.1 hypothetical protein [Candidatus Neptunochlamydia vexilliferae]
MKIERLKQFPEGRKAPCIITEGLDSWPAIKKWSPNFFKEAFGDLKVTLNYNLPDQLSPYLHGSEGHAKEMTLKEAVDFMSSTDRCYLAQQEMTAFEGLSDDYDLSPLLPKEAPKDPIYTYLWIGKNTQSGLHYDYNDNFLIQIDGKKKVFLAPPEAAKHLYPLPQNFTKTQVNPVSPDFEKFPKFRKVDIWKGEIGPGEYLFIPKGWFHHIYAPDASISMNCWYGKELNRREQFLFFYRSGPRTWLRFFKDFFWHGALRRPEKVPLFCSPSLGKLAYQKLFS